jgi:hypothetical protein
MLSKRLQIQLENNKKMHYVFVGSTDCNVLATSCSPITTKGKLRPKQKVWIVRAEPISWPPTPEDLTPCAYGVMWKARLTNLRCHSPSDGVDREFHRPQPKSMESQLRRIWKKFQYGIDVCRATNGARSEHLYINFTGFHAVLSYFAFVSVTALKIQ